MFYINYSEEIIEKRIRVISTVTAMGAILVGINITYTLFSWLLPMCFGPNENWLSGVTDRTQIHVESTDKISVFLIWFVYWVFLMYIVTIAIRLGLRYRRGDYFCKQTYNLIYQLGLTISLAVIINFIVGPMHYYIVVNTFDGQNFSWRNAFYLDSRLFTIFFCGVLCCVIGWVMKIASDIKHENEAIV